MEKDFLSQLNIVGNCRKYGLPVWQCPQFLFLVMGLVIILTSVISYLVGARYIAQPETVVLIVLVLAVFLFIVGFIITRSFEKLAEASRMKSEFINIVSHQMRSPLTNIKWTFEVLSSKDFHVPREKEEEYFVNVQENIGRMVELIDDLLIVSKIEQGTFPLVKKEIELSSIIEELISRYKVFAEASNIKLNFYLGEKTTKVFSDPSLLKLVMENLIDNAVRYTPGPGKIDIHLTKKENSLLFRIQDSGVGIPESEQKYIFQKFYRAENALKRRTRGSGLGLYVCKSAIEKLGGKIWFQSKENKGTTFYFTIPI